MRKFIIGAAGALAMLVSPSLASASDDLTYEEVAHCAAFNLFASDIYAGGSEPEKTKDKSEKFKNQAVALMVAGVALSKKDAETVVTDVKARKDVMWGHDQRQRQGQQADRGQHPELQHAGRSRRRSAGQEFEVTGRPVSGGRGRADQSPRRHPGLDPG